MYLEYHKEQKQVVEIHEIEPSVNEDYDYAKTDRFKPGNEFEWTIWINEVDEDNNLASYSAIRNNPHAKRLLEENKQLKEENAELWYDVMFKESRLKEHDNEIADVWYELMTGGAA